MRQNHATYDTKVNAVKAFLGGQSVEQIASCINRHRSAIYRWIEIYKETESFEGLQQKPRSGRPAKINRSSLQKLERDLSKPAGLFGFETDLWTCSRLAVHLKRKYSVSISHGHLWFLLKKAGFSYQKPERRYYESNPEAQEQWLKKELPKIKRFAKSKRAILYFEDESNIELTPVLGKTWAKKGKTPIQKVTGRRGSVAAMSAISKDGRLVFRLHKGRVKSKEVIEFLSQILQHHKRRHVVVVMDRAPVHTSKMVKEFVNSQKRLHVFYLPPRSPELNPDEKVWNHLKNHELKSHQETTVDGIKQLSKRKLQSMARRPELLQAIFSRCYVAKFI